MKFLLKSKTIIFNLILGLLYFIDTVDHQLVVTALKAFNVSDGGQLKVFAMLTLFTILGNTFLRMVSKEKPLYLIKPPTGEPKPWELVDVPEKYKDLPTCSKDKSKKADK